MKNLLITIALMLGFAVSAQAQTYTLDFVNDNPNGADYPNIGDNERGIEDGTVLEFDGIYIQFSADAETGEGYAYFDGGTAGLGVCGNTSSTAQCVPSSDDNLTSGEFLYMSFFQNFINGVAADPVEVMLSEVLFRGRTAEGAGAHSDILNDYAELSFGYTGQTMTDTLMSGFSTGYSETFAFGYAGQEYYIASMTVSAIPEPATWLMMIIGFGIVSAAARRSRLHSGSIIKTC